MKDADPRIVVFCIMAITSFDAVAWIGTFVFIFWEPSVTSGSEFREHYMRYMPRMTWTIPPYIFVGAWLILKTMIWLALGFYVTDNATINTGIFVVWFINEYFRKQWSVAFMDYKKYQLALIITLIIFGSGLYLVIALGIDAKYWTMGLLIPYVLWVSFAIILNIMWNRVLEEDNPLLEKSSGSKRATLKP